MEHPFTDAGQELHDKLQAHGKDYELRSPLPANRVEVRFVGTYQGERVMWDMQLYTLSQYEQEFGLAPDPARRGLMQIGPQGQDGLMPVQVAIRVPSIDLPVVQKVIIMMRNYKQLVLGLRTWSDSPDRQ